MLSIEMEEFMGWFERKMDSKYAMKMESLKRSLIFFYNLADQVVSLYQVMRTKMEKYNDKEEYRDIITLLNRSLVIIAKITERMPVCLDSHFCDKFIKTFDFNINLLCTYYHSLNHYDLINKQTKFEKDKIVEGINKMYTIHVKVKDIYKHNVDIIHALTLVTDYKRIFHGKINSIKLKMKQRHQLRQHYAANFEAQAIDFYQAMLTQLGGFSEQPQAKKSLMRVYFQLVHQQLATQAQLQVLLEHCVRVCAEIKGKRKNISYIGLEAFNQVNRWVNAILKPNPSLKNLKKLKAEEMGKAIAMVLQQKEVYNYYYVQHFENHQEDIVGYTHLIIDIAKELQKIEQSGLMSLINEYKEGLMPSGSKKFTHRLIQYQNQMSRFYSLHEEVKQLQRYVQSIVLQELGEKVNIIITQAVQEEEAQVKEANSPDSHHSN